MGSKRFTYLTEDGRRHWVRVQKFSVPEGVGFAPADERSQCRSHTELNEAKDKRPVVSQETARDLQRLEVRTQDK
jgi:hypothetical protein